MSVDLLESLKRIAEPVVVAEGMELLDMEYVKDGRGWVLRLYIDKEGGVTIDDCSNISRQVGQLIDVDDLVQHSYVLEVSSPGLNRPLKKEDDFIKYRGKLVSLKMRDPIGRRKNFKGRLLDYREGMLRLDAGDGIVSLPFNKISKANLEYEF
ncbi:MAG: ribosome maturation factor RimP [Pseudomonadota bacterium]